MSDHCCQKKSCELEKLNKRQSKVLWTVLGINTGYRGWNFSRICFCEVSRFCSLSIMAAVETSLTEC